uniref:tRNA(Ile)-lysidine synthase, chloroplastic n=1 Tax=Palmophyllum crassum TaxID=1615899 RepID=A0A1L7NY25_9VIRI|nr:hypothetical chloroplast RF62 [Palmophyllum crassum]BAW34817.1 hypothetical chloroplast RF62 [Palmophyllum crassum]
MCLLKKFTNELLNNNLLIPYQSLLICTSGGQDSLSLVYLFKILKKSWHWRIGIVYCDHLFQINSISTGRFICKLSLKLNFEFYEIISTQYFNSEFEARNWRYKKLLKLAQFYGYSSIITGHTKNDKIESFFLHLLRGSSLLGLQSILQKIKLTNETNLIRPLLNFSRAEILLFIRGTNFPICFDQTNKNLNYFRNRIRNQLIPYLKIFFNPKLDTKIIQIINFIQVETQYFSDLNFLTISSFLFIKNNLIYLNYSIFLKLPIINQRKIIYKISQWIKIPHNNFFELEQFRLIFNQSFYNIKKYLFFLKKNILIKSFSYRFCLYICLEFKN